MRFLAIVCLALPLAAQHGDEKDMPKNPAIGDPRAVEAGHKLFTNSCAACHGAEAQGGRGPNLRDRIFWHPLDDQALYTSIQKGIPGGAMPGANLPEQQVWQLVAFVRSLTAPAIDNPGSGDQRAGEDLFWKTGCADCHRIRGRGGMLGPDLSNEGAARALPQIRESIVDPDADGAPNYRSVQVVLKNGRTLQGVARNRTNYSLQLQDAQGNLHLLSMADVSQITLGAGSPMPKDYARKLSSQDIDNLVAFLSRQSMRPADPGGNPSGQRAKN